MLSNNKLTRIELAKQARQDAEQALMDLADKSRWEGKVLSYDELSQNLLNYRKACDEVYYAMFATLADSGVKIESH